ncbi:uncharacterized protein LOC116418871 isoform X1 [Piliocolobus tephrosceles]|uniref:uncharacterized protein LOC116418871 isoform X1 n=1 Tax=Piliocolobus tephrosceles TaxID=591936 RepID=UPI001300DB8D|nr:uncharacterized protein LOC116418871 isoform X1 [Piliocolobus tephrosceles]
MRIIKREAKPSRGVCVCPGHEHRPVSGVSSPPFAANVRTLGLRKRRLEAMPARLGEGGETGHEGGSPRVKLLHRTLELLMPVISSMWERVFVLEEGCPLYLT